MVEEFELVCVRTCQGWDVAQIYKSKLDAADIPALLTYESAGLIYGITVDGLGEVRVMVPKAYADEARALLADMEEASADESQDGIDSSLDEMDEQTEEGGD